MGKRVIGNKGVWFGFVMVIGALLVGCADSSMIAPSPNPVSSPGVLSMTAPEQACWGQATRVFAQMGEMGTHASQQAEPRDGLGVLARLFFEAGLIPDDTLWALGAYLADELGLSIDACL